MPGSGPRQHLIRWLDGWFNNRDMPGMFKAGPSKQWPLGINGRL